MFGTLAPVFTRYGMHATWADADGGPKVVNAFMPRDATGYRVIETWDTMGMRATSSHDFQLDGVFVPDRYVARILPAGGLDAFGLGIFAWALLGFAHIYHAVAQRAMDLAVPALKAKTALAVSRNMGYHPELQHMIADMQLLLDPIGPHIQRIAEDWSNGVDYGGTWPSKIVSAKYHAVEACWQIVDKAMEVSGGAGMFRGNELEQLFRDARAGRFHPANTFLTHEIVGKTALGIDLGEQPRWG
jgi:alkylation response protein AidB-like acyl-CoA dehydrogenase